MCTLHGPGSQLMIDGETISLNTGEAVFIRGAGDDNSQEGVMHRSPHIEKDARRILLTTDSPSFFE